MMRLKWLALFLLMAGLVAFVVTKHVGNPPPNIRIEFVALETNLTRHAKLCVKNTGEVPVIFSLLYPENLESKRRENFHSLIRNLYHLRIGGVTNVLINLPEIGTRWKIQALYERAPRLGETLRSRLAKLFISTHMPITINPHPESEEIKQRIATVDFELPK